MPSWLLQVLVGAALTGLLTLGGFAISVNTRLGVLESRQGQIVEWVLTTDKAFTERGATIARREAQIDRLIMDVNWLVDQQKAELDSLRRGQPLPHTTQLPQSP